jgi:phage terminase small subunit
VVVTNKKQQMFIEEYLRTWNGTQSAIYAGYSKKTARSIACTLLTNVDIKQEIETRVSENAMKTDEILARLADIARSNFEDIIDIDDNGELNVGLKVAAKKRKLHLLKSVVPTKEGTKYEFHDPIKALELLGKAQGLFTEKVDITTKGKEINNDGYDRAISTLASAIRKVVPGESPEQNGDLDSAK